MSIWKGGKEAKAKAREEWIHKILQTKKKRIEHALIVICPYFLKWIKSGVAKNVLMF